MPIVGRLAGAKLRMMRARLALLVVTAALGCGGGGLTDLEGIYELSSWTVNSESCSEEGPSVLESRTESHLFVRADSFFGVEFVNVVLCPDLETCRQNAAEEDTLFLGSYMFEEGSDQGGWTGSVQTLVGDSCDGIVLDLELTGEAGVSIRVAEETRTVTDVPRDGEGECDFEAARAQAESQPCEELEVVTATFLEGI